MEWDTTDYALLTAALAATHADVQSTKGFLRGGGVEMNPLLGEHPSESKVENVGALTALAATLAANALPAKYRKAFLGGWIGLESRLAYQNRPGRLKEHKGFADVMKKPALAALAGGLLAHHFLGDDDEGGETTVTVGDLGPLSIGVSTKF